MDEPEIKALTVLSLRPGDTLVVEVADEHMTAEGAAWIKRLVSSQIPEGIPVIVTPPDVEFTVVRAAAVPRPQEAS